MTIISATNNSVIESLIERDDIEKDPEGTYEIINPLLLMALREKN